MKKTIKIITALGLLHLAGASWAQTWTGANVGTPTFVGSATDSGTNTLIVKGGGDDIWNNSDNFFYYYTAQAGLWWDAVVRFESLEGPDWWTKGELMVRRPATIGGAPAGDDQHYSLALTRTLGQNQIHPQWRDQRAGGSGGSDSGIPPNYPRWVRIQRFGQVFTQYISTDGNTWTQVSQRNLRDTTGALWEDPILVGVAVTAHNNTDVNGAVAVVSNLRITNNPVVPPSAMTIVTQPTNNTAFVGSEATFVCVATNNSTPVGIYGVEYKWYKNGVLVSTNVMGPQYTFLVTAADAGAQIHCVANAVNPFTAVTATSSTAVLTVNPATTEYPGVKREFFSGASRVNVEIGSVGPATGIDVWTTLDNRGGYGNNYAQRVSGWFTVPTAGNYVFWVASDDDADLFISADGNPANKLLVCQENGWSPVLNWIDAGGGAIADSMQKCSSTWSPDGNLTVPWSAGVPLPAGQVYLEAVMHQGGGGDNFAITFRSYNDNVLDPMTNGAPTVLNSSNMKLVSWAPSSIAWTLTPTNTTVFEGFAATFAARAVNDGEFRTAYQWYRGGNPIAGATRETYSINPAQPSDSGSTFFVVASTQVGGLSITSSVVSLTVQQSVFERGVVKNELWRGIQDRNGVRNGTVGDPTYMTTTPKFAAAVNNACGDNYTRKVSGLFVPPTTGDYVFFVCADDTVDLYVSTDNNPANVRLVAQETTWSNPFQWTASAGGSSLTQKRSDQWSPDGGTTVPYSGGIRLNQGVKYYMMAIQAEGGGGDNVEVTYKFLTDADPINGADTKLAGSVIGMNAVRANTVTITTQPTNTTAETMSFVKFYAAGTTDSVTPIGQTTTDGQNDYTNVFCQFQWQKNGVDIAGAVSPTLTIGPVTAVDNGAVFTCKIRALGYVDNMTSQNPIWVTSQPATLTLSGPQYVWESGVSQVEHWANNPSRTTIEAGNAGVPTYVTTSPMFARKITGGDPPDNYGSRIIGWFTPPVNGSYVFFMNSDDDGDLFISTDSSAVNKRLVARETAWAGGALNWQTAGGGSLASRRSDQYYGTINLNGGQRYYMEGTYHEGGGGDYFAATYILSGEADPVDGEQPKITDGNLGTYVKRSTVWFTSQPANVSATSATPVAFAVGAGTDSATSVGGTGAPRTDVFLQYQWYKNGGPVAGATDAILNYVPIGASDNGAQFYCAVRSLGFADAGGNAIWSNSAMATLTFIDSTAPALVYGGYFVNTNFVAYGYPIQYIVDVVFSERMDVASLLAATYNIPGAVVSSVTVNSNNYSIVELQMSGPLTLPATLTVNGAKDVYGNLIAAGASVPVSATLLNSADVGYPGADPTQPSYMWVTGPKGYIASAQGSDIWTVDDACNFMYETKNGDFDVVVQQKSITRSDYWAKSGLMIRDTVDANSRAWTVLNTPLAAVDGANQVQCTARWDVQIDTVAWNTNSPVPAYPNAWLRLKRVGQVLSAYAGNNGMDWTMVGHVNIQASATNNVPLPQTVLLGICTTGHANDPAGNPPPHLYYNTSEFDNYNSSYIQPPPAVKLTATLSGGNVVVSWTPATPGSILQGRADLSTGNWTDIGPANPSAAIPASTGMQFFRVRTPYTP